MKTELTELIEYIKPYVDKACEGGFSGHNFNSYMPKKLKDNIPMNFRDLISTAIHQLAKKSATTYTNRNSGRVTTNHTPKRYYDFLNDPELKSIPEGFETLYMPWILYEALKCLQLYLDK